MSDLDKILNELSKRKTTPFRLEEYLFDKQLAFVKDPAPFKVAVTTRRAGKSVSCVADLTNECVTFPEVVCLYITLSRKNAKRLVWPEFKKLNKKYKLGGEANESDLSITYPNGSVLYLLGAKDRQSIEDVRGLPVKKAYLDEVQSFPDYIRELIDDVLGPALMDYGGSLCLIGTPGPIPSGYFFNVSRSASWSSHSWSFFDNPHIPIKSGKTHREILDRELKRRGVTTDDPSIKREWFGQWEPDVNSLVFRYSDKNNFEKLPDGKWTYIMGVDLGYDDADAIALLAWNEASPLVYLVEEIITTKQGITELVEQIEKLRGKYDVSKIVMDTGALGKKISEELIKRHQIPVSSAEKHRKLEFIELLNDDLRTGRLLAKPQSQFAEDCMKVEWDMGKSRPDRKVVSDRFHSDICDAVLYAWRECYAYTHEKQVDTKKPVWGSPEWAKAEQERMEEAAEEHFRALEQEEKGLEEALGYKP